MSYEYICHIDKKQMIKKMQILAQMILKFIEKWNITKKRLIFFIYLIYIDQKFVLSFKTFLK